MFVILNNNREYPFKSYINVIFHLAAYMLACKQAVIIVLSIVYHFIHLNTDDSYSSFLHYTDTLMPRPRSYRRLTMSASFVVRKWSRSVRSYRAITSSTPAVSGPGFNANTLAPPADWMY